MIPAAFAQVLGGGKSYEAIRAVVKFFRLTASGLPGEAGHQILVPFSAWRTAVFIMLSASRAVGVDEQKHLDASQSGGCCLDAQRKRCDVEQRAGHLPWLPGSLTVTPVCGAAQKECGEALDWKTWRS